MAQSPSLQPELNANKYLVPGTDLLTYAETLSVKTLMSSGKNELILRQM